jgi:hypothetical protein
MPSVKPVMVPALEMPPRSREPATTTGALDPLLSLLALSMTIPRLARIVPLSKMLPLSDAPAISMAVLAAMVPLLTILPTKLETKEGPTLIPIVAEIVPALLISPANVDTPSSPTPTNAEMVPLLLMPPEKSVTVPTKMPSEPPEILPLLRTPPKNVPPWICVVGATAAAPCAYAASKFDGAWSAVFRTKSGPCPPATRGAVQVANGIIEVASTAGSLSGRVSRTGVVRATGHMGASYGVASGRVSGNFANGTWQAHMAGGSCVGVWTAQRR